jgi:antitoxin PrlF
MTATMTSKNQFTMPREIREHFGLKPGDRLDFEVGPDGVVRVFAAPKKSIERLFGVLKRPGQPKLTLEQMDEAVLAAVAEDHERIFSQRAGH